MNSKFTEDDLYVKRIIPIVSVTIRPHDHNCYNIHQGVFDILVYDAEGNEHVVHTKMLATIALSAANRLMEEKQIIKQQLINRPVVKSV